MASGIDIDEECKNTYEEIKSGKKHRYAIFKVSEDRKKIVVDCVGKRDETYDDFLQTMYSVKDEGRYAVIDYEHEANKKNSKLVFMMWNPDTLKIKEKMVYSASVKALKLKLNHTGTEMQCNDKDDLCVENINGKCQSKYT